MLKNPTYTKLTIFSIIVVVSLGLLTIKYRGYTPPWINDMAGDILYEIFWCWFIFLFIQNRNTITKISLWVFGISCAIECLQLWHPPAFLEWRSHFFAVLLLGTTFDWWDFPKYALGSILGWLWLWQIVKFDTRQTSMRK